MSKNHKKVNSDCQKGILRCFSDVIFSEESQEILLDKGKKTTAKHCETG